MSDAEQLEALNAAFYQAVESADLDAMTALWLDDPGVLCIHPGARPVRGASAVSRSWALVMAHTPYIQFFLTDVEVSVRGDVGYVTCAENVLTAGEAADEGDFHGGSAVATNVFVRSEGGWRLWIHHASPVVSEIDHDD